MVGDHVRLNPTSFGTSTARSGGWLAWFFFWFSGGFLGAGGWRALAKWHGLGGFCDDLKPLGSKFVLKIKYLADGSLDKYKAGIGALGYMARAGMLESTSTRHGHRWPR